MEPIGNFDEENKSQLYSHHAYVPFSLANSSITTRACGYNSHSPTLLTTRIGLQV